MSRQLRFLSIGTALLLVGSSLAPAMAEARGRLGIHPTLSGHGGGMRAGGERPGAAGGGTMRQPAHNPVPSGGERPPSGGNARPSGATPASHHALGWDQASRSPSGGPPPQPRPGPKPGPGPHPGPEPRPGPGPHPGPPPPPPPPPPPAWGWGPYWDWHNGDDWAWGMAAGMATGAVIGAAAASSAPAVINETVVQVLPSSCTATVIGSVAYEQCGSVWYKPQYIGTGIQYVMVAPPK